MAMAARRMPESAARGRHRPERRNLGQQFGCAVGMGSMADEMGVRSRIIETANRRPAITALLVFCASSSLIAEGVYLLSGHSTPVRSLIESMVHVITGW